MVEIPRIDRVDTPPELSYDTWMSADVCSQVTARKADISIYNLAEVPRVDRVDTPPELPFDTWMVSEPVPAEPAEMITSCKQTPAIDSYEIERLEKELEELRAQISECEQELKRKDDEIRRLTDDLAAEKRNIKKWRLSKKCLSIRLRCRLPAVGPTWKG